MRLSFSVISFTNIELTKSFILASCIGMLFAKSGPTFVKSLLNMSAIFGHVISLSSTMNVFGWMLIMFIQDLI